MITANKASEKPKQKIYGRECDVKKACPQPIAQQQKRQNLHSSYNSTNTQSTNYGFNQNKNSKSLFPSPNSMKNGAFRGGYRGKNPMNRSNNGYYQNQNGRRSVDSQYGTIYEHNNTSYNSNFGGRKNHSTNGRPQAQYMQNGKMYNNHHSNKQQAHPQQMQSINQQYYDQMAAQQNHYYGYQVPYTNEYYATQQQQQFAQAAGQQHTNTANAALNTYGGQQAALQTNYAAYNQNGIDPAQYLAYQQYQYTLNQQAVQLNSNLAQAIQATNLPQQQQSQSNAGDFQSLDEHYYQEQQKQFENNLMNNYDKFEAPEDVNNYQTPLINTNLLNVQYQQC